MIFNHVSDISQHESSNTDSIRKVTPQSLNYASGRRMCPSMSGSGLRWPILGFRDRSRIWIEGPQGLPPGIHWLALQQSTHFSEWKPGGSSIQIRFRSPKSRLGHLKLLPKSRTDAPSWCISRGLWSHDPTTMVVHCKHINDCSFSCYEGGLLLLHQAPLGAMHYLIKLDLNFKI